MFGKNPIRKPEKGDGSTLYVQEIFPTVQGEGHRTGEPAVFIRLGGCNLACSFCDTEFEQYQSMSLEDILDRVFDDSHVANDPGQGHYDRTLVVITGGEPLRQNIVPLCNALLEEGYQPQIETNGTLWRDLPQGVEVVCSPKAPNGQYGVVRPDVLERANALKFIISKSKAPYTHIPANLEGLPVWVQPMDEYDPVKNQDNMDYTLALAQQHGYRVSLQTHKLFAID